MPDSAAYSKLTSTVTSRVYGYSGQYDGHRTSLLGFKLTADPATLPPFDQWKFKCGVPTMADNNSDLDVSCGCG